VREAAFAAADAPEALVVGDERSDAFAEVVRLGVLVVARAASCAARAGECGEVERVFEFVAEETVHRETSEVGAGLCAAVGHRGPGVARADFALFVPALEEIYEKGGLVAEAGEVGA
jgi:hypothetical protein